MKMLSERSRLGMMKWAGNYRKMLANPGLRMRMDWTDYDGVDLPMFRQLWRGAIDVAINLRASVAGDHGYRPILQSRYDDVQFYRDQQRVRALLSRQTSCQFGRRFETDKARRRFGTKQT